MNEATIKVQRYTSQDGQPTCCLDGPAGKACRFLGTRKFGTVDVCMLGEQRDLAPRGEGFTRPDERCEVWAAGALDAEFGGWWMNLRKVENYALV